MTTNKQLWLTPAQNEVYSDPARFKVLVAGRRTGKALALTTPILTLSGWKTMGTIQVGDKVFDGCGQVCNVLAVSEVFYRRPCFQVTFSDKSHIIADVEHEWSTYRLVKKHNCDYESYERRVRTTGQIIDLMAPDKAPRIWVEQGATARYVKRIDPFLSVPTRCIEVDSPQRLYLAGKSLVPTHNSRLLLNTIIYKSTNYKGLYDPASPPVVVLTMPTLKAVRAIFWNPLINLLGNDSRVEKIYKSDFRVAMKGNRPDILLRGSNDDDGDNLRGLKLYFVGVDECQDVKLSVIQQVILPALTDTQQSGALFIGTPKGKATPFYKFAMDAKEQKGWAYFHKTTFDNPFIDKKEVAAQKRNLPLKIFKQEFLASWESFGGQIYTELTSQHLLGIDALPESYDHFYMGVDWGDVNPAIVVVGELKGTYYILETWENPNPETAIEQHIHTQAIIDLAKKYPITRAYADPSQPGRIINVRKTSGLKIIEGYNRVSEGLGVSNALFFQNRLFISEKCERFYHQLGAYHRHIKNDIILDEVAPKQDDHLCFVGETQVLTSNGWLPISSLRAGHKVWNREGLQSIEVTMSYVAKTIALQNIYGKHVLRCTPDHPFYTDNGAIKADALRYDISVISLSKKQWAQLTTKDWSTEFKKTVTTTVVTLLHRGWKGYSIGKFGRMLTGLFQRVTASITKMVTEVIMRFTIWKPCQGETTLGIITTSMQLDTLHLTGTGLKMAGNGTENMLNKTQPTFIEKMWNHFVTAVGIFTKPTFYAKKLLGSALTDASLSGEDKQDLITLQNPVNTVLNCSPAINTIKSHAVLKPVPNSSEQVTVHSLKIDGASEFYVKAGDTALLVFNCDALRYILATLEHKNMELFTKPKLDDTVLVKVINSSTPVSLPSNKLYNKRHYA